MPGLYLKSHLGTSITLGLYIHLATQEADCCLPLKTLLSRNLLGILPYNRLNS